MRSKKKPVLANAPDDKLFWTTDGRAIRNIKELFEALKQMSKEGFKHHVNKEKNDFAVWAKDVLKDRWVAREMRRSKTLQTLIKKLETRIKQIEQI